MPTTSINALRYPASSAAPNVAQDIQNLAMDVDSKLVVSVVCAVIQTTAQTGLASGWQTLNMQAETIDTHNGHAANASTFVVPAGCAGLYAVDGGVCFGPIDTALFQGVRIVKNGSPYQGCVGNFGKLGGANGTVTPLGLKYIALAVNDTIAIQGYVNGTGWATAVNSDSTSWFGLQRVK